MGYIFEKIIKFIGDIGNANISSNMPILLYSSIFMLAWEITV